MRLNQMELEVVVPAMPMRTWSCFSERTGREWKPASCVLNMLPTDIPLVSLAIGGIDSSVIVWSDPATAKPR